MHFTLLKETATNRPAWQKFIAYVVVKRTTSAKTTTVAGECGEKVN